MTGGGSYETLRSHLRNWRAVPSGEYQVDSSWGWFFSMTLVGKPKGEGCPKADTLRDLKGPVLDPAQVRWRCTLSLRREREKTVDRETGARLGGHAGEPKWTLRNEFSIGMPGNSQLDAFWVLNPRFDFGGLEREEWVHGVAGIAYLTRIDSNLELSASYTFRYDSGRSHYYRFSPGIPSYRRHEGHIFRIGFSFLF